MASRCLGRIVCAVAILWLGCAETDISVDLGPDSGAVDLGPAADTSCAQFTASAKQAKAAILIVLDRSSSMSTGGKWAAAQQAIIKAIDEDDFDGMVLGLLAYPSFGVAAPACLMGMVPQVSCGVSALPQVPLDETAQEKSSAPSGVRREVFSWLTQNGPDDSGTDASPGYDALASAIDALRAVPIEGKRLILLITDGGFSCTSMSEPPRPGYSDGLCLDWEVPDTVAALLKAAHDDPQKPISSFIVGVPGSDSAGEPQGSYATAPYQMRLALSSYARAGSPDTIDPSCDGIYSQGGGDPAIPCHFDMTSGAFDASALAAVIGSARDKGLACVYDLPDPPSGQQIDKNRVNVLISTKPGIATTVPRRSNSADPCEDQGCWDYNDEGQVELIGKACRGVSSAPEGKVEISVGCATVVK